MVFCVLSQFTETLSAAYILRGCWCRYACDGDRHEPSLLRFPGQSCYASITTEAQTSMSMQLLTQRKYQAFLPRVSKRVRGQYTLPHTGTTGCGSEGNSLSVREVPPPVQQLLTCKTPLWHTCTNRPHHTTQTKLGT